MSSRSIPFRRALTLIAFLVLGPCFAQTPLYMGVYKTSPFLVETFGLEQEVGKTNVVNLAEYAMELGLDLPRGATFTYVPTVGLELIHRWGGHQRFQDLLRQRLHKLPSTLHVHAVLDHRPVGPRKVVNGKLPPVPLPVQQLSAITRSGQDVRMQEQRMDAKTGEPSDETTFHATPTINEDGSVNLTFDWSSHSLMGGNRGRALLTITNHIRVADGEAVEIFRRRLSPTTDEVLTLTINRLNPAGDPLAEQIPAPVFLSISEPRRSDTPTTAHIGFLGRTCFGSKGAGVINEIVKAGFNPGHGGLDFDVDTQTLTHLNYRPKHVELVNLLRENCIGAFDHIQFDLTIRQKPAPLSEEEILERAGSSDKAPTDMERWRRAPPRQTFSFNTLAGQTIDAAAGVTTAGGTQSLEFDVSPTLAEGGKHVLVDFTLQAGTRGGGRSATLLEAAGSAITSPGVPVLLHARQLGDTQEGWFLESQFLDRRGRPVDRYPFGFEINEEPRR